MDISCVKYEFVMGITRMKQFDSERLRSGVRNGPSGNAK
jgi:hypothetical protein